MFARILLYLQLYPYIYAHRLYLNTNEPLLTEAAYRQLFNWIGIRKT